MMEREKEGHRLFCGCDDQWDKAVSKGAVATGNGQLCPKCSFYPWYYPNPADEPHA